MQSLRLHTLVLSCALVALCGSAAVAQSTSYTSAQVMAGNTVQLSYHASANRNCTPGKLPSIQVLVPPQSGALIVRRATLTTDKIAGCPRLKTPAQVVLYQADANYSGIVHVGYVVTDANGPKGYDVTITVKPAGAKAPSQPATPRGTPL